MELVGNVFNEKKRRLKVVYIGAAKHEEILTEWCKQRGTCDFRVLFGSGAQAGMQCWTRAMPSAEEMVQYVDLMRLYLKADTSIAFSQVEISAAILNMNGKAKCIGDGDVSILTRKYAGCLIIGLSRFRDLRIEAKSQSVYKHASEIQIIQLDSIKKYVCVRYDNVSSETRIVPWRPLDQSDPIAELQSIVGVDSVSEDSARKLRRPSVNETMDEFEALGEA